MDTSSTAGTARTPFEDEPGWQQAPTRRFERSARDRKVAGVAGGLGRALRIDPVLIRVAFVVLTLFGGSGIALYALGWLLLPGPHDEVSPAAALLGRGRSTTPPVAAVVLGLVVVGSATSSLTVGLPLTPIAILALVLFGVFGRHQLRHWGTATHGVGGSDRRSRARFGDTVGRDAQRRAEELSRTVQQRTDEFARRAQQWGEEFGRRTQGWGAQFGRGWSGGCSDERTDDRGVDPAVAGRPADGRSPFDAAPAWEDRPRVDLGKGFSAGSSAPAPDPTAPRSTPPAWDPLGAAPFAWDLPEPGPTPPSPAQQRARRRSLVFAAGAGAVALGVLAVGGVGQCQGWWTLPLAAISGAALAVVAVAVLLTALRGRRSPLIGVGVLLAIVTGFLAATGVTGTGGIGDRSWRPADVAAVQPVYRLDAGQATLDLSAVVVPAGTTLGVDVELGAGNLQVVLPGSSASSVTCTANLGSAQCLDQKDDGVSSRVVTSAGGPTGGGTLVLTAHVGTGELQVTRG